MYLSLLEVDGSRPPARAWLSNTYRVHQRLLMAFGDGEAGRVLFRIEANVATPRILVQSQTRPDWDSAFADLAILRTDPRMKEVDLVLKAGQRLRFRIRANPTKRIPARSYPARTDGDRVPLTNEAELREWLARKGRDSGFLPVSYTVLTRGNVMSSKGAGSGRSRMTHFAVDFEGVLEVTDPAMFQLALVKEIGAGKGLGFGLLSVAPA